MIDDKELLKKVVEYKNTGDEKIKLEIYNSCKNLVNYYATECSKYSPSRKEEYVTYCKEGLLFAIENYNLEDRINFIIYVNRYIENYIKTIIYANNFKLNEFIFKFKYLKSFLEEIYNTKLEKNPELIKIIIDCISKNYGTDINISDYINTGKYKKFGTYVNPIDGSITPLCDSIKEYIKYGLDNLEDDEIANLKSKYSFFGDNESVSNQIEEISYYYINKRKEKKYKTLKKIKSII